MLNLLRADFLKLKKDKNLYIAIIIVIITSLFSIFTYLLLGEMIGDIGDTGLNIIIPDANGKGTFLSGFNVTNNVGLIIPIMLCLFVGKEFNYGTIRNKLMIGKKRSHVYLSNLIIVSFYGAILITIYLLLSLLLGSLILGYGTTINGSEIVFLIKSYILGLLVFLVSYSIVNFICFSTKSMTMSIVVSIVFLLVFGLMVGQFMGINDTANDILSWTFLGQAILLLSGNITNMLILKVVLSSVVTISAVSLLGIYLFKKSDLK